MSFSIAQCHGKITQCPAENPNIVSLEGPPIYPAAQALCFPAEDPEAQGGKGSCPYTRSPVTGLEPQPKAPNFLVWGCLSSITVTRVCAPEVSVEHQCQPVLRGLVLAATLLGAELSLAKTREFLFLGWGAVLLRMARLPLAPNEDALRCVFIDRNCVSPLV